MTRIAVVVAVATVLTSFGARAAEREKMLFLGVQGGEGFSTRQLGTIEDLLLGDLQKDARLEVISKSDLATLVGVEAQKQALGCDEGSSCMTELAGAVGAPLVARASVGRLGSQTVVALSVLDAEKAKQLARPTRTISSDDELPDTLADLVNEALAKMRGEKYEPPRPPTERAPFSVDLMGNVGVDYDTSFGPTRVFYGGEAIVSFGNYMVIPRLLAGSMDGSGATAVSAEVGYLFDPDRIPGVHVPQPAGLRLVLGIATGPGLVVSSAEDVATDFQWGLRIMALAEGKHLALSLGLGSYIDTAGRQPVDVDLAAGWKF